MTTIDTAGPAYAPDTEDGDEIAGTLGRLAGLTSPEERAMLLERVEGQLLRKGPAFSFYSHSIGERSVLGEVFDSAYLPAEVPGPREKRYSHEWRGTNADGLDQVRNANAQNGRMIALSIFVPRPEGTVGFAAPALGIEVEPALAASRLHFEPYVHYSFGHKVDVPTAFGNPNSALTGGELIVSAERILPGGTAVAYDATTLELWRRPVVSGEGYGWERGQGRYPGKAGGGLSVLTGKGERLRLWVQIKVSMSKMDHDPQAFTQGQAYIDCEVPMMWVTETPA